MGRANAVQIRACQRAWAGGPSALLEAAIKAVEKSQSDCPHALTDRATGQATRTTPTLKKGEAIVWCLNCSKLLDHEFAAGG
jgi:hypothetical protein